MDIFSWSIPFVAEKINEMLYNVIKPNDDDEDDDDGELPEEFKKNQMQKKTTKISPEKQNRIRRKLIFLSKMMQLQKTLRENNEKIVQLKQQSPDGKLKVGLLQSGKQGIQSELDFEKIKEADQINERRPEVLPSFGSASKGLTFSQKKK
eukprot:TRINITY_DN2514_c0_g1_i3.p3 TRINITY_DN2514_c0_g1~~TRINITY_DN2514_c0_g1_i3.p3  ORF type:complete len:150 (+),score=34.49 TRINITY_DN2514_c0_g1_i3:725-1174(+)